MSGPWRAALRLAGREVRRARWRSALVVAMVGVPVLLIVAFTVLLATVGVAQSEPVVLLRQLGAADAQIVAAGREPVVQDALGRTAPLPDAPDAGGSGSGPWTVRELAEAAGGRVLPVLEGGTLIRTDAGALSARVREFDLRDPLTTGLAAVTEGRAPQTTDEVAVSRAVADRGFGIGTVVRLVDGGERTVVGLVRDPAALRESEVVGLPGSVLVAGVEPAYLVDTAGTPVSWARVRELNALGLVVNSRAVLENPPPDDQLPPEVRPVGSTSGGGPVLAVLIMGCVVLEVALLAGPGG